MLADEVERRDRTSAGLRARAAHLDPTMALDAWDPTAKVTYDRASGRELTHRCVSSTPAHNVLILGPRRPWLTLRFLSSGCVEQSRGGGVYVDS